MSKRKVQILLSYMKFKKLKLQIPVRIRMDTFLEWVLNDVSLHPEHLPLCSLLIKTFFVFEYVYDLGHWKITGKHTQNEYTVKLGKHN